MSRTKSPVTVTELARRVRLSPATVSKALNGRDDVSEATRRQVLSVARELNFPLRSRRAGRRWPALRRVAVVGFGLMSRSSLLDYPFARLIHAFEAEVRGGGGELLMEMGVHGTPQCYQKRQVDGIIVLGPVEMPQQAEALDDMPVVCAPDPLAGDGLDRVCQDNPGGVARITRYLIDQGHRRIAFAAHSRRRPVFVERCGGYLQAMYEADLEPLLLTYEVEASECHEPMADRIASCGCTALVAANDNLAADMVGRLTLRGWTLPEQLSIVGFDHWPQQEVWPAMPLTTVDGNLEEVARQTLELLRYRARGNSGPPLHVTVVPRIVEGNSVAAPGERRAD